MSDNLYLIIKTNKYTGNFERELMAYVFGITEEDEYAEEELAAFRHAEHPDGFEDEVIENFDEMRRGRMYSEYHGYFIDPHPEQTGERECDSIYIAVENKFTDETYQHILKRLEEFTHREKDLQIVDISYFREVFVRAD